MARRQLQRVFTIGPRAVRGGLIFALIIGLGLLMWTSQRVLNIAWPAQSLPHQSLPEARAPIPDEAVFEIPTREKVFSLTVNVDWGTENLEALLRALADFETRVTFFPTGRWAQQNPKWIRRFVEAGHEVANHGMSHRHPKQLSSGDLKALIEDNARLLTDLTGGQSVNLFAPPYGEFDRRIVEAAKGAGHATIMWTIDTVDWKRPAPEVIVQRVLAHMRPGAIVLMHPVEQTVRALPTLLSRLREAGYHGRPLAEMMRSFM